MEYPDKVHCDLMCITTTIFMRNTDTNSRVIENDNRIYTRLRDKAGRISSNNDRRDIATRIIAIIISLFSSRCASREIIYFDQVDAEIAVDLSPR